MGAAFMAAIFADSNAINVKIDFFIGYGFKLLVIVWNVRENHCCQIYENFRKKAILSYRFLAKKWHVAEQKWQEKQTIFHSSRCVGLLTCLASDLHISI